MQSAQTSATVNGRSQLNAVSNAFDMARAAGIVPPVPSSPQSPSFEPRLVAAMARQRIKHLPGDGKSFRQAVLAPLDGIRMAGPCCVMRSGSLRHLLIERVGGQVLALCLMADDPHPLHLNNFMQQVEAVLKRSDVKALAAPEQELAISRAVAFTVCLDDVSLALDCHGFYANAIPGLAALLLANVVTDSAPDVCPDLAAAHARLVAALHDQLRFALQRFTAGLDARIAAAITRAGSVLTMRDYNQYASLGRALKLRRLQAAEAFPLIGVMQGSSDKPFAAVRRAIDRRLPLLPVLAKGFKTRPEVIHWLVNKDIACVGESWAARPAELAQTLALVCPEQRPGSSADWSAFTAFATACALLDRRNSENQHLERVDASATLLGQIAAIGWHRTQQRLATLGIVSADLPDMADLIDEIVALLALHIGAEGTRSEVLVDDLAAPVKKLFFSIGIVRQLRASQRWHQLLLQTDAPTLAHNGVPASAQQGWPAPFEGTLNIGGVLALGLTNPAQLKDEGQQMQHCARHYEDHCRYWGSSIVSLRLQDGQRLSTVELMLVGQPSDALRFVVRQHRGLQNCEPPAAAQVAVTRLLQLINDRRTASHRLYLYQAQTERKAARSQQSGSALDSQRLHRLRQALALHVGFERFEEAAARYA